jgi:hypothetical protein
VAPATRPISEGKNSDVMPAFCQKFRKGGNLAKTAKAALLKKMRLPLEKI